MPWPTPGRVVAVGLLWENAQLHLMNDQTAGQGSVPGYVSQRAPTCNFAEYLLGHRSGINTLPPALYSNGSALSGNGATVTYTVNTLTDTAQNWPVNSQVNKVVFTNSQMGVVASNTATTLTFYTGWPATPAAGTAYYISSVLDVNAGATVTYGTNTLVDTAKAWRPNQLLGLYLVAQIPGVVGYETRQIIANTATTITVERNWISTPTANGAYGIQLGWTYWHGVQRGSGSGGNPTTTLGIGASQNPDNI